MLDVENRTRPHRTDHSLQHCSLITDIPDLGMLGKGQGLSVDTPDTHRQEGSDTSMATTIHIDRVETADGMVWDEQNDGNLPQLPEVSTGGHLAPADDSRGAAG